MWGCPVFVLDPKLQDGKKITKWNRWSRLGQFLGFSNKHFSLVAKVETNLLVLCLPSIMWFLM